MQHSVWVIVVAGHRHFPVEYKKFSREHIRSERSSGYNNERTPHLLRRATSIYPFLSLLLFSSFILPCVREDVIAGTSSAIAVYRIPSTKPVHSRLMQHYVVP